MSATVSWLARGTLTGWQISGAYGVGSSSAFFLCFFRFLEGCRNTCSQPNSGSETSISNDVYFMTFSDLSGFGTLSSSKPSVWSADSTGVVICSESSATWESSWPVSLICIHRFVFSCCFRLACSSRSSLTFWAFAFINCLHLQSSFLRLSLSWHCSSKINSHFLWTECPTKCLLLISGQTNPFWQKHFFLFVCMFFKCSAQQLSKHMRAESLLC